MNIETTNICNADCVFCNYQFQKRKTGIISFEFTSEFFKDAIKCLDYLNKLGYKKFNYSEGERKKFNFDWTSKDKILEEIENKIKTNNSLWGDIYGQ